VAYSLPAQTTIINPDKRHRFPVEIISPCAWLNFRFCLSGRDVEALLFARGIIVTYEAIRQWCQKFGRAYAHQLRHHRSQLGDTWHLEICQSQPIKMSWCPLRHWRQVPSHLRGRVKREHEMHVHLFSRDNNFADQASGDGLPFSKRELF
jgi:hypothetical protein